jgi:hypothetical protein
LIERSKEPGADLVDVSNARDFFVPRGILAAVVVGVGPIVVVVDERLCLCDIDVKPPLHSVFLIVISLNKGFTRQVVAVFDLWGIEFDVVSAAGLCVDTSTAVGVRNYC